MHQIPTLSKFAAGAASRPSARTTEIHESCARRLQQGGVAEETAKTAAAQVISGLSESRKSTIDVLYMAEAQRGPRTVSPRLFGEALAAYALGLTPRWTLRLAESVPVLSAPEKRAAEAAIEADAKTLREGRTPAVVVANGRSPLKAMTEAKEWPKSADTVMLALEQEMETYRASMGTLRKAIESGDRAAARDAVKETRASLSRCRSIADTQFGFIATLDGNDFFYG